MNLCNSTEIQELAEQAELKLVPQKSKLLYEKEYEKLMEWKNSRNYENVDETLMLAYMNHMSSKFKASSMWCIHSKLQAMLRIKNGINIAAFPKLHAFMKGLNKGHVAKKSFVFTEANMQEFFKEAPDETFLFLKVVAICGVFGSCRRSELCDLVLSDIKKEGAVMLVTIRPSKTDKGRKFAICDDSSIPYVKCFEKYLALRPRDISTERVFLKYGNGKCCRQVVGINTFGKCPSLIAKYLNLPDFSKYTGHAFRRTSATIMANSGMTVDELKRQVGWKSSTVASGYIENSTSNKIEVCGRIAKAVNATGGPGQSINIDAVESISLNADLKADIKSVESGMHISNNTNCNFNIYLK